MLVSDYDQFVQDTDKSGHLPPREQRDIAIYGLASEIGSVAAAIKKQLLNDGGKDGNWNKPNKEIVEELGDVTWYCFALARLANPSKPVNIFIHDINKLRKEISANDDRAKQIETFIGPDNREEFLRLAESFPRRTKSMTFDDYQRIAFLTARTEKRKLVEVCIAVLYQLSAELFRNTLPDCERELNTSLPDRDINDVLGEIAWHLAALASIYDLHLGDVAAENMDKVSFRWDRRHATALHDANDLPSEKLPRKFEVTFVTIAPGRSQMYWNGRRLGDPLTDNAYEDDGYRFHDVMHLANVAMLGWSPVTRKLMGRKRKSQPKIDEVEDGARAQIVEEAVIKAIHSEGVRLAKLRTDNDKTPSKLFPNSNEIGFRFLKLLRNLVAGLEVEANKYWEWDDAIIAGCAMYHELRTNGQGTVFVDMDERSLTFRPEAFVSLAGRVVGLGSASAASEAAVPDEASRTEGMVRATKLAILASLGFPRPEASQLAELAVEAREDGDISVKANGSVQQAMWDRNIVTFRRSLLPLKNGWQCVALALSDE